MSTELTVIGLGRMPYGEALAIQREAAERRIAGDIDTDLLLLVEHPPVITTGRATKPEHLSTPEEFLEARGVELFDVERGGDVTFHGPGQIVGYPIYRLSEHREDLHWFLRQLEQCLIDALRDFGIEGIRNQGLTGVWVKDRKIASIGIHVRKWVTWHGFALNVMTRLDYFDLIVPCGIANVEMTSIQKELGERSPPDLWSRALDQVMLAFCRVFGQTPQAADVTAITGDTAAG